jgi:hypothetical protein
MRQLHGLPHARIAAMRRTLVAATLLIAWCHSSAAACKVLDPDLVGVYEGSCNQGFAEGRGRAAGKDLYDGEFRRGKPHGNGTYRWSSTNSSYSGEFVDGLPNGRGHHRYGEKTKYAGDEYEGEVKAGRPDGKGIYRFANGDVYEGQFRAGKRHGTGAYRWANGCSYVGQFRDGNVTDRGRINCPAGQSV